MNSYSSGFSLGPHQEEDFVLPKSPSFVERRHPHLIPSTIILLALLSFAGNLAFAYMGFVRQGMPPEVTPPTALLNSLPVLGSDDSLQVPQFTTSVHFRMIDNPASLRVSAQSYIVADAETGEIIIEKDADTPFPMASVSKLLTAVVSKEQIDARHQAVVSKNSYNTYGTEGELSAGEKILVSDLYYPLLMESSNDAAEVLADDFGRESFMMILNEKADALGMYSTHYDDPSGLSPGNVSTAHDLTKLGLYIYAAYPEILDITRVKGHAILGHSWANKNLFLNYPNFLGGKNGFINEAKKTTLSYFKVYFRGEKADSKTVARPLILVLLRSNDRDKDAALILSYVAKNIRYVDENSK